MGHASQDAAKRLHNFQQAVAQIHDNIRILESDDWPWEELTEYGQMVGRTDPRAPRIHIRTYGSIR